jgi:hypothetical protein
MRPTLHDMSYGSSISALSNPFATRHMWRMGLYSMNYFYLLSWTLGLVKYYILVTFQPKIYLKIIHKIG